MQGKGVFYVFSLTMCLYIMQPVPISSTRDLGKTISHSEKTTTQHGCTHQNYARTQACVLFKMMLYKTLLTQTISSSDISEPFILSKSRAYVITYKPRNAIGWPNRPHEAMLGLFTTHHFQQFGH